MVGAACRRIYTTQKRQLDGAREIQFLQSDLASENFNKKTVIGTLQHLLNIYYVLRALYISRL